MQRIFPGLLAVLVSSSVIGAGSPALADETHAADFNVPDVPAPSALSDDQPGEQEGLHFADHRFTAGVFIGGNYFSDEIELGNAYFDDQIPDTSPLFGVRSAFVLLPELFPDWKSKPRLSIEAELKLASSRLKGDASTDRPESAAPVLGWRAHALVDFWPENKLAPFVLLGAGGETLLSGSAFVESPDTDAALHWGVGGRYTFGPKYAARLDLRQGITAGRHNLAAITYEIHFGLAFAFDITQPPKVEREVIVVTVPAEKEPEPPKPAAPADKDGDGIPDDRDECPSESEVKNLIDDSDGCPEADSDGDGLLGTRDSCPAAAEDKDGFEDENGCPDPDNDGDGVADAGDSCIADPETKNGFQDGDGCPDEVPEKVKKFTGRIAGIRFRSGSAEIRPSSAVTLDKAAAILKEYPDLRIEVSGHTDTRGSRELNMRLSQARADAVKLYLVEKGIDADRIETVGYGPDKPIGDNRTRAGRALNRRIEFKLLSTGGNAGAAPASQPSAPAAKAPAAKEPATKEPAAKKTEAKEPATEE